MVFKFFGVGGGEEEFPYHVNYLHWQRKFNRENIVLLFEHFRKYYWSSVKGSSVLQQQFYYYYRHDDTISATMLEELTDKLN